MAHYAMLDDNSIVTEVIVGADEHEQVDWEQHYGQLRGQSCKRTSYNTRGGEHLAGGAPFRKNYAGIGYFYDAARDAFIPPKVFPSWVLNEHTCLWDPPVPCPQDGGSYTWNEARGDWVAATLPPSSQGDE